MLREKEREKFQYLLEIRDHISRLSGRVQGKNHSRQTPAKIQLYILFIPDTPEATPFMVVPKEIVFLISQRCNAIYLPVFSVYFSFSTY